MAFGDDDLQLDLGTDEAKAKEPDNISRYLDNELGVEGEETQDTDTESGDKGKETKDGGKSSDARSDSSSDNKNGNTEQKSNEKGKKDEAKAGDTHAGDLKLEDGTVVKNGAERRFYERAQLAERQLSMRTNELQQANQSRQRIQDELNSLRSSAQALHGADPAHVSTGLKLVRDLQRDPAGTLKTLLTEAMAAGYTVEGIAGGVDAQAIRNAVLAQFQPLVDASQQQTQQQEIEQRAQEEVTQFYTNFPDARIHDEVLAAVMDKNPQLDMAGAYYQLKLAAIERGLDWSKPLAPQMQAGEQQQQQPQQQQQKPMPNGRQSNGAATTPANKVVVAHESTETSDIVKSAMREAGLNI